MRLSPFLGLGLLIAACGPRAEAPAAAAMSAPVELSAAALDTVKMVDAAFAAAMNARDTTALFAIYGDNARLLPPDSPIIEGPGIRAFLAGMLGAGASDFQLTPLAAGGAGDLAWIVGHATFKIGGATEDSKYAEVLRRGADGKWHYLVDMFNSTAPAAKH